jgi:hypothetical protein
MYRDLAEAAALGSSASLRAGSLLGACAASTTQSLGHDVLLGDLGQLQVGLLLLLERQSQQLRDLVLPERLRQGDIRAVSRDLVMLDPLHACYDHQIKDRPLLVLLDLVLRLLDQAAHRLAHLPAGSGLQLLQRLLDPLDLNLGSPPSNSALVETQ